MRQTAHVRFPACLLALLAVPLALACKSSSPPKPLADAGLARTVNVGAVAQLDGSRSTPGTKGDLLSYEWAFVALPAGSVAALNNPAVVNPSFVADVAGDYQVRLVAVEGSRRSLPAFVMVTASACGGGAPSVTKVAADPAEPSTGQTVLLTAETADPDNEEACGLKQPLSYRWSFLALPAGSGAMLNHADAARPSFLADLPGEYQLQLVVSDPTGRSSEPAVLVVTVSTCGSAAPAIDKVEASPAAPGIGARVTLSVSVTDADNAAPCSAGQKLRVESALVDLPAGSQAVLSPAGGLSPAFVPDVAGEHVVLVTVTDDTGRSSSLEKTVEVSACGGAAPVIESIEVSPGTPGIGGQVVLAVVAKDADNEEACGAGQVLALESAFVALPAGSHTVLAPDAGPSPAFVPDTAGDYVVRVTVSDGTGRSTSREVTVIVSACGGATPAVVTLESAPDSPHVGDLVVLDVVATDADNDPLCNASQVLTILSGLISKPAGSVAVPAPAEGTSPAFLADLPGTYVVRTTVTDSTGRTSSRDLPVTVGSCGSAAPRIISVKATPSAPNVGDPVDLAVVADDPDNAPECGLAQSLTLSSALVSLPAGSAATLSPAEGATPAFVPDVPGAYVVRTTVSDGTGRSATLDTIVTVSTCGDAVPVVAQATFSPTTPNVGALTTLTVTASDADNQGACNLGQVLTTSSALIGQPAGSAAALSPAVGASPAFVPDVPGTYAVRVTVTDPTGRGSSRDVAVTASACGSHAPQALVAVAGPVVAGPGAEVTAPRVTTGITVALDASASSDADNACLATPQVLQYAWFFVSKPAGSLAALNDATLLNPSLVADRPGAYRLGLRVTDGQHFAFAYLNLTADPAVVFGTSGSYQVALVASGPLFNAPEGVTTDDAGTIYVVQNGSGRVTRTTGGITAPFGLGGYLAQIHDVAYYPAGKTFFVTSNTMNAIVRLDGTGQQTLWTQAGAAQRPAGIVLFRNASGQDRLLVGTRSGGGRMQTFDPAAASPAPSMATEDFGGNLDSAWGVDGAVVSGVNTWFVADNQTDELWRTDGATDRRLTQQLGPPADIAVAPSGKVVVADSGSGMVVLVTSCTSGDCPITPVAWGDWEPWGLAFESPTALLVTDRSGDALYRITGTF